MRVHTAIGFAALIAGAATLTAGTAMAAGDAAKGKADFAVCAVCHSVAKGAPNKIGPNLWDVVGSKPGTVKGFNFSAAMKNANFTWTEQNLAEYIDNPQKKVPGNRMPYGGTHNMPKAQDIAAYLATLK